MIEANLMLGVTGKTAASFTMMDALRFPLGILSGIGFIGAGAIVRRDKLVTGITTAATLWLITVIGLVLGAGYIAMGSAMVAVSFVVLAVLKKAEPWMYREHRSDLTVRVSERGPSNDDIRKIILDMRYKITSLAITQSDNRVLRYHLEWESGHGADRAPPLVEQLAGRQGVLSVNWDPVDAGHLNE
jgi:putative Mg2+ transporter-C (MgtC) family protein